MRCSIRWCDQPETVTFHPYAGDDLYFCDEHYEAIFGPDVIDFQKRFGPVVGRAMELENVAMFRAGRQDNKAGWKVKRD